MLLVFEVVSLFSFFKFFVLLILLEESVLKSLYIKTNAQLRDLINSDLPKNADAEHLIWSDSPNGTPLERSAKLSSFSVMKGKIKLFVTQLGRFAWPLCFSCSVHIAR